MLRPLTRSDVQSIASGWWLLLIFGFASVVAGLIVVVQPGISLVTLAWVTGIFLLIDGVFELVVALGREADGRAMTALLGIVSIIAGLFLVRHPIVSVIAIALFVGVWLVVVGIARFVDAFGASDRHRLWSIVLALLEVAAGVVIVSAPDIGVATLALIIGIVFLVRGIGICAVAWGLRSFKKAADRV